MKDITELLMRIITRETQYAKSMRHSLKEEEFTILRLQNEWLRDRNRRTQEIN